jgi:8-oxo-dGTP pyrophosphatase MutT (NUDIX family)
MVRDKPQFEVLMVKRHHQVDFASGALVFPGGKTAAEDHDEGWSDLVISTTPLTAEKRGLRIAAIREAFEEAGILLGRQSSGEEFKGHALADEARPAIARDQGSFLGLVRELGIKLDLDALTVFARWITPNMMPKRFDTWFYVARASESQLAACDGRETVDAEWIAPATAIDLAKSGARTVIFPTRMNLQLLAEASSADDAVKRATERKLVPVEPVVEKRPDGDVLVIPHDAGYGNVVEPMSAIR